MLSDAVLGNPGVDCSMLSVACCLEEINIGVHAAAVSK